MAVYFFIYYSHTRLVVSNSESCLRYSALHFTKNNTDFLFIQGNKHRYASLKSTFSFSRYEFYYLNKKENLRSYYYKYYPM